MFGKRKDYLGVYFPPDIIEECLADFLGAVAQAGLNLKRSRLDYDLK